MLSFKQFLTEARMAPLYHATNERAALNILNDNKFKAVTMQKSTLLHQQTKIGKNASSDSLYGVSLTRNLKLAKGFGYIIFVLDQQKLAQNYKIKPFNYWNSDASLDPFDPTDEKSNVARISDRLSYAGEKNSNEYEEFVYGDIKNAKKYITKVLMQNGMNKNPIKLHNIPVEYF